MLHCFDKKRPQTVIFQHL